MMKLALIAGVCGITLFASTGIAHAMAAPPCVNAKILPAPATPGTTISIPANLPGFGYAALKATAADVHLTKTGSPETPLALGGVTDGLLKLTPSSALAVGSTYTLTWNSFCGNGIGGQPQSPFTFNVTASAPIPTKVGTASGVPTVVTKDFGTTQYEITAAYTFDAEIKPWLDVYQLFVVVDGKLIGTKPVLNGTNSVDVKATGWCEAANAQTKTHKVLLRAKLPFAPVIDSASADVVFDCPAPVINPPPGVKPGSAPTKTGTTSGGTGTGTGTTSSSSGGTGSGTGSAPSGNNGGETTTCNAGNNAIGSSRTLWGSASALILGLVGLFAARRRRDRH